jgi:hypothetical protein
MRDFIWIDLTTLMLYLPDEMRNWTRERILAWLSIWGDVRRMPDEYHVPSHLQNANRDLYGFRSWCGRVTGFILTEDGRMRISGTSIKAWSG